MKVDLSRDEIRVLLMVLNDYPMKGLANQAAAVTSANKLSIALNATVPQPEDEDKNNKEKKD